MHILHLDTVDSTNAYLMRDAEMLDGPLMVCAHTQTAGQGQRGNSWESEPGKNLTFSIFYRPLQLPPMAQFSMSEAVALGVVEFLRNHEIEAKVKWPNDIYVGDKKICGILIRHSILGEIVSYSVIGVGINVNQQFFFSDAPNPVSMTQITGESYDISILEKEVSDIIEHKLVSIEDPEFRMKQHNVFIDYLWRGDGKTYPFIHVASGEKFMAQIEGIAPHGPISLLLSDGSLRTYAFKEVSFII